MAGVQRLAGSIRAAEPQSAVGLWQPVVEMIHLNHGAVRGYTVPPKGR
jgi:hypothetical protein